MWSSALSIVVVITGVQAAGGIDGFQPAQWARARRPGIRIALSAGIRRTAEIAGDYCEEGPMLAKPDSARDVELRIRALLAT